MQADLRLALRLLFWLGFAVLTSPVLIAVIKVTARLVAIEP